MESQCLVVVASIVENEPDNLLQSIPLSNVEEPGHDLSVVDLLIRRREAGHCFHPHNVESRRDVHVGSACARPYLLGPADPRPDSLRVHVPLGMRGISKEECLSWSGIATQSGALELERAHTPLSARDFLVRYNA